MKSLGNFLRYARKRSGLTQEQIAERLNIVTPVLSKWENDKAVPTLDLLCKLCNILNISIEECINAELSDEERVLPPENYQPEKLGETLKNLRLKNGWSQAEIGKKMFVTSQTVSKWETGGVSSLEILGKLAELFGLTPTELINGLERIKEKTDIQTAAEQLKKPNRFALKITAIILAIIIFLGAVTGLIVGLVFKNINDDRKNNEDKTQTEQPDEDNSNESDYTVNIEFGSPVKLFYSAEVSFHFPNSFKINIDSLLFFEVELGDGVYATADGTVVNRDLFSIDIDHGNGLVSSYSMVETLEIEAGSEIKKGQLLGTTSDSYLGFGLTLNGETVNPLEYLTDLPEPIERPPEHVHEWGEWQSNQTQHWQVCMCGEESERNSHTFIDNICTVCGYEKYIPPDEIKAEFTVPINSDMFRTYLEEFMATDGYNTHRGIDFSADAGDKIYAVADGEIARILDRTDYFVISINHGNGVVSVYSGVTPIDGLTEGQEVEKGSVIACVSETPIYDEQNDGPHLHFGMQLNGYIVNPLDYIPYENF